MSKIISIFIIPFIIFGINSCGEDNTKTNSKGNKDIQEYTTVNKVFVGEFNQALAEKGKELFKTKCTACHDYDKRIVGPPLGDIAKRRTPEYIISMITSPDKMIQNNDTAKALLQKYLTPMTNQNINIEEARAIYEHFREISK